MGLDADVIVVGAGASGLRTAAVLAEQGRTVLILEARDRIGGKIHTARVAGHPVDLGAHWIGPGQDRTYALVRRLGLTVEAQRTTGRGVLLTSRRRRIMLHPSAIPVSPLALAEVVGHGVRLELAARGIDATRPWRSRHAARHDHRSLGDAALRTRDGRALLATLTRTVSGAEPREMSELSVLAFRRGSASLARLTSFKGGAQQDHLSGGMAGIVDGLAAPVRDRIRLGHPVDSIRQHDDYVIVTAKGQELSCRRVVMATAPALNRTIDWTPELPENRRRLDATSLGAYTKYVVAFERPFWRDRGLSGIAFGLDRDVQMVVDLGTDGPGLLAAFVTGEPARRLARLDEAGRRAAVSADLVAMFGREAGLDRWIDTAAHQWLEDPWSLGAPVTVFGPGVLTAAGAALRRPHRRVHWAGTDTATQWAGYVEGALQSGERAAAEVHRALT